MGDFEQWWANFPRKVGKLAAAKAYEKARKLATADELLEGVRRYMQSKPAYADWCMPITWLRQGRWMDQPDSKPEPQPGPVDWYQECREMHGGACGLSQQVHHTRKILDAGRQGK